MGYGSYTDVIIVETNIIVSQTLLPMASVLLVSFDFLTVK